MNLSNPVILHCPLNPPRLGDFDGRFLQNWGAEGGDHTVIKQRPNLGRASCLHGLEACTTDISSMITDCSSAFQLCSGSSF
ncbi:MAG: hypothetical protein ACRC8A_21640 [Microcoleaceae cyanobacterium]